MEDYPTNPEEVSNERSNTLKFTLGALKGAAYGGVFVGAVEGADALGLGGDIKAAVGAALIVTVVGGVEGVRGKPFLSLPRGETTDS
jgi:hypothetical protein